MSVLFDKALRRKIKRRQNRQNVVIRRAVYDDKVLDNAYFIVEAVGLEPLIYEDKNIVSHAVDLRDDVLEIEHYLGASDKFTVAKNRRNSAHKNPASPHFDERFWKQALADLQKRMAKGAQIVVVKFVAPAPSQASGVLRMKMYLHARVEGHCTQNVFVFFRHVHALAVFAALKAAHHVAVLR